MYKTLSAHSGLTCIHPYPRNRHYTLPSRTEIFRSKFSTHKQILDAHPKLGKDVSALALRNTGHGGGGNRFVFVVDLLISQAPTKISVQ